MSWRKAKGHEKCASIECHGGFRWGQSFQWKKSVFVLFVESAPDSHRIPVKMWVCVCLLMHPQSTPLLSQPVCVNPSGGLFKSKYIYKNPQDCTGTKCNPEKNQEERLCHSCCYLHVQFLPSFLLPSSPSLPSVHRHLLSKYYVIGTVLGSGNIVLTLRPHRGLCVYERPYASCSCGCVCASVSQQRQQ